MTALRKSECVEIGAIPIALSTSDGGFLDLLRRRYAGFLSSSRPEFALEFDLSATYSVSDEDVRVCRDGDEWMLQRGDFRARWDPRAGRGTVRQDANPYSLDTVLRILHSLILAERGGFLLHAASAICDGQAFLFSGVSGAGKTTMTRLAPPDVTLLTDEISYVCRTGDGYRAFGTPFAGDLDKAGMNISAPIAGLYLLAQGRHNHAELVPSAGAARRLLRNILFFADDSALVERLFRTACEFVLQVPVYELTFQPEAEVWNLIE